MLTQLTEAQQARLPVYRDKWLGLGLCTQPANRTKAERGAGMAYRAAGLPEPQSYVWCDSPYHGAVTASTIAEDAIVELVDWEIQDKAGNILAEQVSDTAWADVIVPANVIFDHVYAGVKKPLTEWFWSIAKPEFNLWGQIHKLSLGQHDAQWMSFFDFFLRETDVRGVGIIEGKMTVAANSGWWWPFERTCILTECPCFIALDEKSRLHHATRPAIEYRDGWGVHAWHGVTVPASCDKRSVIVVDDL